MTGQELVQLAMQHLGEHYDHVVVPKDDRYWRGSWDCAEFTSWLVYQATGRLYGCQNNNSHPRIADAYTGYWARDAKRLGLKVDVGYATQIAGAFILRVGIPMGHIVVSDGRGGTVEAKSHQEGVVQDVATGRRWDMGVLPYRDLINYDLDPLYNGGDPDSIPGPVGVIYRLKSPYMRDLKDHGMIYRIQIALMTRGFGPGQPDGIFGPLTNRAVCQFQEKYGLVVDGEVGPQTLKALRLEA